MHSLLTKIIIAQDIQFVCLALLYLNQYKNPVYNVHLSISLRRLTLL